MRRFGFGVLGAIAGYVLFALCGYALVTYGSSNVHDRALEASMTAAFVAGPLGALIGLVAGIVMGGRKVAAER